MCCLTIHFCWSSHWSLILLLDKHLTAPDHIWRMGQNWWRCDEVMGDFTFWAHMEPSYMVASMASYTEAGKNELIYCITVSVYSERRYGAIQTFLLLERKLRRHWAAKLYHFLLMTFWLPRRSFLQVLARLGKWICPRSKRDTRRKNWRHFTYD